MFFLIRNNEVSGKSDTQNNLPEGFEAIKGEDLPIESVYYDALASCIKLKPPKPSETAYWNPEANEWVKQEFIPTGLIAVNRWADFLLAIIQTTTYEKIKVFLGTNDPNEYTVLVALLNNSALPDTSRERLLENALRRVKTAMKGSSTPLTSKDVATINELLSTKLLVDWNLNG